MKIILALALMLAAIVPASAETYVVSPRASAETKAAVAAGKAPEHGFPAIENVQWSSLGKLRPGATLTATVSTSPNVNYVEARVKYWNIAFTEVSPRTFHVAYRVPLLPPTAIGQWELEVIARSIDGVETKRSYPIRYSYF